MEGGDPLKTRMNEGGSGNLGSVAPFWLLLGRAKSNPPPEQWTNRKVEKRKFKDKKYAQTIPFRVTRNDSKRKGLNANANLHQYLRP